MALAVVNLLDSKLVSSIYPLSAVRVFSGNKFGGAFGRCPTPCSLDNAARFRLGGCWVVM